MPTLYLTPASLSYLAQLVLSLAITSHLLRLWIRRRGHAPAHVAFLTGFFAGFSIYLLLLFQETALLPGDRLFATYLQIIPLSLGLVCLIQFTYHFPSPAPRQKWERRAALILTLSYALWESWYALIRLRLLLTEGHVRFRHDYADIFLAIIFLWAPLMLVRQSVRASAEAAVLHPSAPSTRFASGRWLWAGFTRSAHLSSWLRHLHSPQGQAARTARALALVYLLPFALSLIWLANSYQKISVGTTNIIFSLGILSALFAFAVVYLNILPETTTFMVKVAGAALAVVLAVLSVVGWAVGPLFADQYPEDRIPERQTVRFTPNAAGGYNAAAIPFHLDPAGEQWGDPESDDLATTLPFAFPFYNRTWQEAQVSVVGMIRFGQARSFQDLEYRHGTSPGILPLYPTLGVWPLRAAQVFLASHADKVTITWRPAADARPTAAAFAVQLILYPSGIFEITYDNVAAGTSRVFWRAGVIAGAPAHQPRQVDLVDGLPLSGGPEGIVHDGYRAFRGYLHRMLSPLAWLIAGSALLIVVGLPVFLRFNLVRPLETLLNGVRRVEAGDLKVEMPVEFMDEIGSLTRSFNGMVAQLRALVADLESRVAGRTADLAAANARLRAEVADTKQAEEALQHARDDLSALYEVSAVAGRALDLKTLLSESLARAMAAIPSAMGAVLLLDETGGEAASPAWRLAAHRGIPAEGVEGMRSLPADRGLIDWILDHHEPLLISDASADPRVPDAMRRAGPLSLLAAPLDADEQVLGVLGLARRAGQDFDAEEIALLASIADQLGVAVRSHHLRELAGRTKMLEDRQALARDMHDSVTQMLYALTALTEAAQTQLETGAVKDVGPTLARVGDTARQALKEMRLFIHQLRPSALTTEGLVAALHMRLAAVEGRSGIRTHLLADENLRLPPAVENELYPIALEALNNTLRHAQASAVTVTLRRDDAGIDLEIADDGRGFDPLAPRSGGMGLINMRERAESLGGVFGIASSAGAGTRITIAVPNQS